VCPSDLDPKLEPLKNLEGVAGASAGAITALLLALGYSPKQMRDYLEAADFTRFFDPPDPRRRPQVGGSYDDVKEWSDEERSLHSKLTRSGLQEITEALNFLAEAQIVTNVLLRILIGTRLEP